jgi:hypothetical protein
LAFSGTVKHDKKINVWGCFTYDGVGHIHRIVGIMDAMAYKQILIHHMVPSAQELFGNDQFIFQQDNDPKHTSISCTSYLRSKNINVIDWPSQSSDLNLIENLWGYLDSLMKDRRSQNEEELFEDIKEAWLRIPLTYLHNLVDSMPRRCQAVIDSNG